jgi:hypothetical protein
MAPLPHDDDQYRGASAARTGFGRTPPVQAATVALLSIGLAAMGERRERPQDLLERSTRQATSAIWKNFELRHYPIREMSYPLFDYLR